MELQCLLISRFGHFRQFFIPKLKQKVTEAFLRLALPPLKVDAAAAAAAAAAADGRVGI